MLKLTRLKLPLLTIAIVIITIVVIQNINDSGEKIIGSDMIDFATKKEYSSIEKVIHDSGLIIEGEVISESKTVVHEIISGTPLDEKILSISGVRPTFETANTTVLVNEVIYGNYSNETLVYVQLGNAESHKFQTKVKKGDKVLLMLGEDPDEKGEFSSVSFEKGVFIIDKSNKVISQSNHPEFSQYDRMNVIDFKNIILDKFGKK